MKIDYTTLSFTQLIDKIEKTRFFDLPRMVREAFRRLLSRVESLETSTEPKYKVYTALLNQSGTDAPIATVLENTLGGTVVWSYEDVGVYRANLAGAFTENKTAIIFNMNENVDVVAQAFLSSALRVDLNSVEISVVKESDSSYYNGGIQENFLEIRVYN